MNRTHTTTPPDPRFIVAVVIVVMSLAACGESTDPFVDPGASASVPTGVDSTAPTDTTQPSDTTAPSATNATGASVAEEPEVNEVAEEGNEGGFGAPAAAPGEFGDGYPIPMTASVAVDGQGCWYLTGRGSQSLLIAPEGTVLAAPALRS